MFKYFISHSNEDLPFVENELIGTLRPHPIGYWYSVKHIMVAEYWERSIQEALESCDGLILVMSPAAIESDWVKKEVDWAFRHRPGRVIPILLRDCEWKRIHEQLQQIQYIDLSENLYSGLNKLIAQLNHLERRARSRVVALSGLWTGTVHQEEGQTGVPFDYPTYFQLQGGEHMDFFGTITTGPPENDGGRSTKYWIKGELRHERFAHFNYFSQESGAVQFGTVILELNPHGDEMEGYFLGFGAFTRKIVRGRIEVKKVSDLNQAALSAPPTKVAGD